MWAMSAENQQPDQFTPWDQQPRNSRGIKYAALAIGFFALGVYRSRDRLTPTLIGFTAIARVLAGIFAWGYESHKGFKFDWLFSLVMYVIAFVVAIGLLLLAIFIYKSM
jgi:hypothetical protein